MEALLWPALVVVLIYAVYLAVKKAIGLAILLGIVGLVIFFVLGNGFDFDFS